MYLDVLKGLPACCSSWVLVARINRLDESEIDLLFDFPSGEGQSRNFGLGKMNMWMGQVLWRPFEDYSRS